MVLLLLVSLLKNGGTMHFGNIKFKWKLRERDDVDSTEGIQVDKTFFAYFRVSPCCLFFF